jgi:hypothetical protein
MNQEELKELFFYDDGWLYWKVDRGRKKLIGKKAGSINKVTKYWRVKIFNKDYLLHRLIFLYHKGAVPPYLDHIDGNKLNNRIENLREATISQNNFNSKRSKRNKSGVKNVYLFKPTGQWVARLRSGGKNVFLKYCDTIEEAEEALKKVRKKYHGEFSNDGFNKDTSL